MGTNNPQSVISVMMILWHFWRNHEGIADSVVKIYHNLVATNNEISIFQLLLSAKHVFVSNNTVFGERQAPS